MRAMVLKTPTGPDGLGLVERPTPDPGPGEVLVRLRAASLNYRDLLILKGGYRSRQKQADLVPLSDGAGDVAAVGQGATRFRVGDRVTACFFQDWPAGDASERAMESDTGRIVDGNLQEFRIFPEGGLVSTPSHLSDVEAAALPCAALTAWSAVVKHGRVKPGDCVLTQGTGGVSLFALQFAHLAGARVIVTSSSDDKLARARALGAADGINYRAQPEWGAVCKRLAGGDGVDNVIELGGTETIKQSLIAVRPGGTLSLIGVLSGATTGNVLLPYIISRDVRLQGVTIGSHADMTAMGRAIEASGLHPVVDRVFPFADAKAAFEHLASGTHFGKVCIEI
ncbi:MAG: NAD(P)-dependent alcohol dehydrogenase [Proteobacteria bacterium]|nr:NAD(P)-dependent alcohol dehydrogenase [Pseudomonadota bacterium]